MISVNQLSKSYAKKTNKLFARRERVAAVSNVSFSAADGAITGLLGANGAGKSSTLRMIASLLKPDSGSANIDGFDVVKQALEAREMLGFMPHNSGIYPRLTAVENILYYAQLCGMSKNDAVHRVRELVAQLEMGAFAERRAEGFSQGQKTKVALARALVHKPKTLILDEPSNGLDVMATRNLRMIIQQLKQAGHCILLSSHVMQEVTALCDHVVIIQDGSIAIEGTITEIKRATGCEDFEEAFVKAIGAELKELS